MYFVSYIVTRKYLGGRSRYRYCRNFFTLAEATSYFAEKVAQHKEDVRLTFRYSAGNG